MQMMITGRDNKTLKQVRALQRKKGRMETGLYVAEGVRLVQEALLYAKEDLAFFLVSESFAKTNEDMLKALDKTEKNVYIAKDDLFSDVCDTQTPQGVLAVLRMKEEKALTDASFLLILDGVSEPGNLGTIIRTAEATGVDSILLMKGCVDLYNPKVVRSTMGSLFRMPCKTNVEKEELLALQREGFSIAATALRDSVSIDEVHLNAKRALVIGSEAFGVSEEVLSLSDVCVHIPMEGKVESLNAAIAGAICMYVLKP